MKIFTFSTQKCFFIGKLLNFKLIALGLVVLLGSGGVWGQNFSDNASNYSSWTNGSNQGTGFGAWAFTTGTNSGSFLGNPANNGMGTTGIGTNAFGMYATGSGYMNALRPFSSAMEVGDKFSFYWAINWDANGGGKGFDLKSGGTTIFNVNNFNSSTITTTNGNAFTNYGTSPMLVTLIRTSSTQYSFRMTARDGGSDYTTTINSSSQIDRINFYIGNQNNSDGNRNMFFNHLTIEKGRYRSKVSGAWNNASTWQVSTDGGSTWADANSAPSNSNGPITILNTHEVTVSTTITIDQTTIDAGGKVILATSGAITVANGADANDFTINGVYERQASATTMTPTGTVYFGSGSTYIHNVNGGTIPTSTWHSNSTLQIDQSVSNNEFTETFGNVTINGSSSFSMYNSSSSTTMNIAGNLTFNSSGTVYISGPSCNNTQTLNLTGNYLHTGSGSFIVRKYTSNTTFSVSGNFTMSNGIFTLGAPSGTSNYNGTLNITSNLTISAGQFNIHKSNGSSNSINNTVNVTGNFEMSGGGLLFSDETGASISSNAVYALLNVKGNFTHTSGTISETASDGDVITRVTLNGTTGTQTLESTGQTGIINFNVAASGAQCIIAATKTFTLSSASKMTVGAGTSVPDLSVSGIFVNSSTTTLGTTATTGTWAVNSGGNYVHNTASGISTPLDRCTLNAGSTFTYRGSSSLTPSSSFASRTYRNLVFESTSGNMPAISATVTSALVIEENLTIGSGTTFNFNNTGTPGNSIKGNISVAGTLNFSPSSAGTVNLNGSSTQTISGSGTFTTGANSTLLVGETSTIDFGATNAITGSGTFTTSSGSTLITANTSGINGSLTLSNRTLNAGTNYTFNGSPAQVTGAALSAANNITLNNSNGLTLSENTSITGTLTLTSGKLTTNGKTLALSNAVSGASSSNYIIADATGTVTFNGVTTARVFPLGTASAYAPMTVTAGSSTNYTAYVTGTSTWPGSCTPTTTSQMVNLAWGLSGSNTPSQVVFQWPAGSQAGSFDPATSCDLGRYNTSCPYNVTNISAASGSGPYTLTCTTGLGSTSNIYVIGNQHAVYIAAPTVTTTVAASSITNTTASSGGQTLSGTNITSKGVVWNTATAPTVALSIKTNDGTGSTDFTSSITSLSPQTLHYIRAYVTNAAGTAYGDEKTFRTLSNPATVQASGFSATTTSASNIDLSWTGATFPVSGATNKNYVLLRATSPNTPSLGNSNGAAPTAGANTTIVSSVIAENATSISSSGLAASTQYNYLLIPYTWDGSNATTYNYLTTSAPTANATTQSGSTPPVLTTNAASSVLSTTATLNGEITADGGASVSARGFVYSTSDNTPTLGEGGVTDQSSGSGTGTFNSNVSSLPANTTHYYQAYATNTSGTSYGGVISFTTLKAEPSAQATSLVFSSITTSAFSTAFSAATGSPDGYLVIRSTSASLSADPVDGTTYTAGNSLGGGTIVSVGSTISGISNTSLSAGTTYYTFVFAYNNSGSNIDYRTTSPLSASTITLTDAPATPTFSSITTSGFTVDWTATSGASSYRLDVSTASNFSSFVSGYEDLTVNTNSQAVTGLTANTLYYVRVRAVNASGTSANSTSSNSATLPNVPTVGTASSITTSGLTANWSAPSSQGAVTFTYTVELSTSSSDFSSPVSTASSIASGTTSNAFTSLSEGTTYYYRIKAVNSEGSSAWSSVSAGATTLTSSISLTALGTSSTQDFNTLATSGTSSTLPSGWYLSESGTNFNTTLTAGSGSGSGGDTYSFGTGTNSDRAFGGLRSGTLVPVIGAKFVNNTGSTISNLEVSFTGEQWRLGATGRVDRLDFQYSFDATSLTTGTWTDFNSLDFTAPVTTGATGAIDGNASANRSALTATISSISITNGAVFLIRWTDFSASGANDGLAIDDFSIKPCGTVSEPTASDQAFCSATSPTVASLTATGTAPQWYSAETGGTALSTSTALTNSTTYYASQTVDGCESVSRTPVVVTVNTNPSAPTGSATQTFCSSDSPTVNELSATGTAIQWYAASSEGSALATSTALVNGTHYYASQTTNSCESTTRLDVTASFISSGNWIGTTDTDWNTASNWCGGVPTSSTNVVINSGASNYPNLSSGADGVVNSITINSGGSLTISGTESLTISSGGSFTNNGTFTANSGTSVLFAGSGTITGTVIFNNLSISGTVTPSISTTINGILSINNGGSVITNSPVFGAASTLNYNYGGGFGGKRNQATEWPSSNGPANLTLTNGSWIQLTGNRSISGNVTITNGALQASGGRTLTMNGTTQSITVSTISGGAIYGTDNGSGNDLSLNISDGSTTSFTGDATSNNDDEKKLFGITVSSGGTLILQRGILCKYGTFTVNGTLRIDANSYVQNTNGVAPTYGSTSSLIYNTGGSFGRGIEWSTTSGAGYPNNVQVSNNSTLNVNNGGNVARQMAGNLTVDAGSTVSLEGMTSGSFDVGLTVLGNVSNSGTITLATSTERLKCVNFTNNVGATTTLSSNLGGDLELTGTLLDNATFTSNNRAVFFTGTGTQDVSGSGTFNIDYIVSNKASGTIRMLTNLLVEGPNGGNALTLSNSTDIFDLNGFTLTLGKTSTASGLSGNGLVRGSATSSLSILGTGALGTLRFDQTTPGTTNALQNLTINRTSTGSVTLGNNLNIGGNITLTDGSFVVGANTLTINGNLIRTSGSIDATNNSANVVFAGSGDTEVPISALGSNLTNLTVNKSGKVQLGGDVTVNGTLTMTLGDLDVGANNLTLSANAAITNPSASSHILATSTGELRKIYSGSGSFTFPVGDGTNYTPATVNFTNAGSFNGETTDYLGVRLKTSKVTNMNSNNTSYINRSWFIEPHNSASGFTYTVNLSYTDNDVVGTESEIRPVKLSSGVWQYPGDASFDDGTQLTGTSGSINTSTDVLTWSGLTSFSEFGGGGQGGPLPVELTSFSSSCEEDIVTLSWSTASEQNSSHFDVEKSNDGSAWRVIGSISAAGNSTQDINYSFVDSEKSNDQNYYRLNQVDIDGKNKIYDPIFVDCEGNASQLITYPNPSKDGFNIVISDSKLVGESILIIRDAMGKVVLRKSISIEEGTNLFPIAANEIENGVYFITIENANNDSETIKHVKN
jgi:hypothetical protein